MEWHWYRNYIQKGLFTHFLGKSKLEFYCQNVPAHIDEAINCTRDRCGAAKIVKRVVLLSDLTWKHDFCLALCISYFRDQGRLDNRDHTVPT